MNSIGFDKERCNDIVDRAESTNSWRFLSNGVYHYHLSPLELTEYEQDILKQYCIDNLNLELLKGEASIMKYTEGDYILPHVDRFVENQGGTLMHTRMLYNINVRLNDNFTGGEFYLEGKPFHREIGKLYHYKSDQVHEVRPITSGTRYTVLFYIKEQYIKRKVNLF